MKRTRGLWAAVGTVAVGAAACAAPMSNGDSTTGGQYWESPGTASSSSGGNGGASTGGPPPAPRPAPSGVDAGPAVCAHEESEGSYTVYQSTDDSNSMASPAIARALIERNQLVPAGILRTYEFLNYYRLDFPEPALGDLSLVPQLLAMPDGSYTLQVGVQSAPLARRAKAVTLVLDTSGSMAMEVGPPGNRSTAMQVLKDSVRALAHNLSTGDLVSVVTWNTAQRVVLDSRMVTGPDDAVLLAAVDALSAGGGTDLNGGLVKGYELATRLYDPTRLNRVVIISDGVANVGTTNAQLIARHSHNADEEGIYLVGIGVGVGVNDTLMDVVTDRGRGAYVYLDSAAEAELMLGLRFDEVMEVAARSVRLQMTLPWFLQVTHFAGEQMSTNPDEVDPQHLAPGDAMVFHQSLVGCSPAAVSEDPTLSFKVTWSNPGDLSPRARTVEIPLSAAAAALTPALAKGMAVVAYAEALKSAAADARTAQAALDKASAAVQRALELGADTELTEIAALITQYRRRF